MTAAHDRASDLFHAALELDTPVREEYLQRECADDRDLLAEVRSLLAADGRAGAFLEPARFEGQRPDIAPGSRVGRYVVVRAIGSGGMGTVYEARQEQPRRTVALKIIRPGAPGSLRRFEFEAEALARLHHAAIAQVHEAGVWEGLPYIAMEWIGEARTITAFADSGSLGQRERIELMARVCDAVQHAHQHGVIHRDLKPGNILVGAEGDPKVIDFGVARAVDTGATHATLAGQLVGTLDYMSPEQCAGESVDTRADVYSLGIVLYELLTGALPRTLEGMTILEASRTILDQPVCRPSTLARQVRGDLETILLKALEREPHRRYQSCADLARDLHAFLAGAAIDARRDSTWYVIRKTLRRHRVPVAGACLIGLTIAGSSITLGFMYARQGHLLERVHRREAESRRALSWLQDTLASLDPAQAQGAGVGAIRAMLADASERVGPELADQPEAEAAMRSTIGRLYRVLGKFADAELHLRRALEIRTGLHEGDHPDTAATLTDLGATLLDASRYREAEECLAEALAMRQRLFTAPHSDLAYSLSMMAWPRSTHRDYAGAEAFLTRALAMYRELYGEEHATIAKMQRDLGVVLYAAGQYQRAEPHLERSIDMSRRLLGDQHAEVASGLTTLAKLRHARGREAAAEPLFREALSIYRALYGERHPNVAWVRHRLGLLLHDLQRDDEAAPMIDEALASYREFQGENDPYTAFCLESRGTLRLDRKEFDAAEADFREAAAIWRAIEKDQFAPWHDNRLGCLLQARGDAAGAEPLLRRALSDTQSRAGEGAAFAADAARALGTLLRDSGRRDEARAILTDAVSSENARLGPDHPRTRALRAELNLCD